MVHTTMLHLQIKSKVQNPQITYFRITNKINLHCTY